MKLQTLVRLVGAAMLAAPAAASAQTTLYSETFSSACTAGCSAGAYAGWTVIKSDGGANGPTANEWYVSCSEPGSPQPLTCAAAACSPADQTLHIGYAPDAGGDTNAVYLDGFVNATAKLAYSPKIDSTGKTNLTLGFDFIASGSSACSDDGAQLWLSGDDGNTWPNKYCLESTFCAGGCGGNGPAQWTRYGLALPAAYQNNPAVRVGFHWMNNGNSTLFTPSLAVNNLSITYTCAVGTAGSMCQYSDAVTCNAHGVAQANGSCVCSAGFGGANCNACAADYYGYPSCTYCLASSTCAAHGTCSSTGTCTCSTGYAGSGCQYSDATTCSGHGAAQTNGSCTCATGFSGTTCNACAPNYYSYPTCTFCSAATTCNNQGTCSGTGACVCSMGFTGSSCQYSNATTCSGHGVAQANGSCVCATGFSGAACDTCATDHYGYPSCLYCSAATTCSAHGTCSSAGGCQCATGFAGPACQYSDATTCSGHGTAQSNGSCVCATGFGGANCSACATNYYNYPTCTFCSAATTCNAHGTCTSAGACSCSTGFAGTSCQYGNSTTCNGHGVAQANGSCTCATTFAGATCNTCATDHYNFPSCTFCNAATTCSGHGVCAAGGGCTCAPGYAGPACQYTDATTCSGHGTAQNDGSCACAAGFAGASCNQCAADHYVYPTCMYCDAASTCGNHGTCNSLGICTCTGGFVGPSCQFSDLMTCNGRGKAQGDGTCQCNSGLGGAACDQCAPNHFNFPTCAYCDVATKCSNHGVCNTSGGCDCSAGFAGASCQYSDAVTCNGHGTVNAAGACTCSAGYTGATCNACATDYFNYPTCTYCNAATTCGGQGTCNSQGACVCSGGACPTVDAGTPDSGQPVVDAGTKPDSGQPLVDSGVSMGSPDAGTSEEKPPGGCGCSSAAETRASLLSIALLGLMVSARRRTAPVRVRSSITTKR